LGVEIHYSARKTPWFKGKIERWNGTVNRETAHGTPGTTFQNIFEKSEYDPAKHAVVRYSVLKEIIYTWIVDVYQQRPHRTLKVPPALMWERSISPDAIPVPDDPAQLDAILGRSEVRRLTHKGIELYGLLYNSPELTILRRDLGDKFDVEIRVDAADIGKIIVFSPDKRQMFTVHSLSPKYAAGLSEWQHRVCKRYAAAQNEFEAEGWLEAKLRIAELIQNEVLHKKQRTRSRIARYNENVKSFVSVKPTAPQIDDIATSVARIKEQPRNRSVRLPHRARWRVPDSRRRPRRRSNLSFGIAFIGSPKPRKPLMLNPETLWTAPWFPIPHLTAPARASNNVLTMPMGRSSPSALPSWGNLEPEKSRSRRVLHPSSPRKKAGRAQCSNPARESALKPTVKGLVELMLRAMSDPTFSVGTENAKNNPFTDVDEKHWHSDGND